jgi:transposase
VGEGCALVAAAQATQTTVSRTQADYRKILTGIIFVLKMGIPWEELPAELGCGSGMSCLNYLRAWQAAGVWDRVQEVLQAEIEAADKIDWSRAAAPRDVRDRRNKST